MERAFRRTCHLPTTCLLAAALTACGGDDGVAPDPAPPDPPPGPSLDEAGTWTALTPMPLPLANAAAAVHRGQIYLTGGVSDTAGPPPVAAVLRYDPATDTWTRLADLPNLLSDHAMVVFRDTLMVLGGQASESGNAPTARILAYDTEADRWDEWGRLPLALWQLEAVAVGDRILVLGGSAFISPPNDSITVIQDRDRWHYAPAPDGGWRLTLVPGVLDGVPYVLRDNASNQLELLTFDLASERWSSVGAEPVLDQRVTGTAVGSRFHVVGDGQPSPKQRAFRPGSGTAWLSLTPPPRNLVDRMAVGLSGRLYLFGGYTLAQRKPVSDALVYVPPD